MLITIVHTNKLGAYYFSEAYMHQISILKKACNIEKSIHAFS